MVKVMKRPASAPTAVMKIAGRKSAKVLHKRASKVLRKKPAGVIRKRPSGPSKETDTPVCKAISEMTSRDFLFLHLPAGRGCWNHVQGCKSSRKGYVFQHVDFNTFTEHDIKIPKNAKRVKTPPKGWLSEFFLDPAKRRLSADASALPVRASGKPHRIEGNQEACRSQEAWLGCKHRTAPLGGMPFVVYVRDDAVSVFRLPKDGYILEEDEPNNFETARLFYTEEVTTLNDVVKSWIGIDGRQHMNGRHGNSMLVHVPPSSKGRMVTAVTRLEGDTCHVLCTDMAGQEILSVSFAMDAKISALVSKVRDCLCCLGVKCFDEAVEVQEDQPLVKYKQLTLKDCTQSYVYIGSEIYSFDVLDEVTSYYSRMGVGSVPYPVAVTPSTAIYMLDRVQVPREQLAPFVMRNGKEEWADSYGQFYQHQGKLTKAQLCAKLANVKDLCPRQ